MTDMRWLTLALACCVGTGAVAATQRVVHVCDCPPTMAAAEREGLLRAFAALGFRQGQNLDLVTRDLTAARDSYAALLARERTALHPDLFVVSGIRVAEAAKAAALGLPIVFFRVTDPVGFGLVDSLAHPGGQLTGFSRAVESLTPKRLELLHDMLPRARQVAFVFVEDDASHRRQALALRTAGPALGLQLREYALPRNRWNPDELDGLFRRMQRDRVDAFLLPDLNMHPQTLVELAARYRLPTIHSLSHVVTDWGGLAAYATEATSTAEVADYAARILRGARAADLPVQEPTRFELILNLRAARDLGLAFPESFKLRASQLIEK